ncbi:MAG: acyl-CoA dehydrogenase family protein, partial [Proteobacteria bacterium]|nr:acyl-CoA dehydrogenase family protein [Pseudomonadota bacterium]
MAAPKTSPNLDFFAFSDLLSDEQRLVGQATREFVSKELSPIIASHYMEEQFPESKIPQFGALGLLGSNLKGYGLPGMDNIS